MNNNNIVFTIVAKNYVGLATVLGDSVVKNSPDTCFYVFVADEPSEGFAFPANQHRYFFAKDVLALDKSIWERLSFQYNLTEFCTAIKPFCLDYIMRERQNDNLKIIYFDPDILVYSSLNRIWEGLDSSTFIITPHIVNCEADYTGSSLETNMLASGIYNLGFLGVKKGAQADRIIKWWQKRLLDRCYVDRAEALYTDQKWIDFLPALLDSSGLQISRDLGMNVAPWNFHERKIVGKDGRFWVRSRNALSEMDYELCFVHFSGFDYKNLQSKKNKNILNFRSFEDYDEIIESYQSLISHSSLADFLDLSYTYNFYHNKNMVLAFHRRLYRRFCEDGNTFGNPFDIHAPYYKLLKKKGLIDKSQTQIDKLNERNFSAFDRSIYILNIAHKLLFKLLGFKRYALFSKFMARYHRPENQVFLLDKAYMKSSFKNETFK